MKRIFFLLVAIAVAQLSAAEIRLPALVGDNMILQQNTTVRIWGWGEAGKSVALTCDWQQEVMKAKCGKDGYWEVEVRTLAADHIPHSINIAQGKENVTVGNILFGEVWIGGGQSNMEISLNGYWTCPIAGSNRTIAEAGNYPEIRYFNVQKHLSPEPQDDFTGKWEVASSETTQFWSATGYFFAKHLYASIQVPVGMIISCWGGSKVEGWMPKEDLLEYDDIDYSVLDMDLAADDWRLMNTPYEMYNGMIKPISRYTIAGFIFYQGCSNVGFESTYASRLSKMVKRWRSDWGLGDLPFFYVEIAPYNYGTDNIDGALLREAQFAAQALIPNSGMVCTNDLVLPREVDNIHPRDKESVGERLSWYALNRVYGFSGVLCNYPSYKSMEVREGKIYLTFDNARESFGRWGEIIGFEVAGEDRVFHPATDVEILMDPHYVVVSCSEVPKPVAARYCFKNFSIGNLINHREMPTVPFRTDRW